MVLHTFNAFHLFHNLLRANRALTALTVPTQTGAYLIFYGCCDMRYSQTGPAAPSPALRRDKVSERDMRSTSDSEGRNVWHVRELSHIGANSRQSLPRSCWLTIPELRV